MPCLIAVGKKFLLMGHMAVVLKLLWEETNSHSEAPRGIHEDCQNVTMYDTFQHVTIDFIYCFSNKHHRPNNLCHSNLKMLPYVCLLHLSLYSTGQFLVALGQVTQYILRWQHLEHYIHR